MNEWKVGKKVFSIRSSDGKAKPEYFCVEYEGTLIKVTDSFVEWCKEAEGVGGVVHHREYPFSEQLMLAPNIDGVCHFFTELDTMDKYEDGKYYKVPSLVLREHMKTYVSPFA